MFTVLQIHKFYCIEIFISQSAQHYSIHHLCSTVCLKVIDKFSAAAKKAGAKKSNAIEKVIQKECKKFKDSKETRMVSMSVSH